MAETPASSKVAKFRRTDRPMACVDMYAITYLRDGVPWARGFARGDELDEWRTDLEKHGWVVDIDDGAEMPRG